MERELKEDLRHFLEDWFYGGREKLEDHELEKYFEFYDNTVEIYTDRLLKDACSEGYLSPFQPENVDLTELGDYFGINTDYLTKAEIEYLTRKYWCEIELEKSIEDILFKHGYEPSPHAIFYPTWEKKK